MLNFIDTINNLEFQSQEGYPYMQFGAELATVKRPLDFIYQSDETTINTFTVTKLNAYGGDMETTTLSTSLISASGSQHICNGLVDYSTYLTPGIYYFLVNNRYKSENFIVLEIETPDSLLLESGDFLLLESGFKLILG